MKRARHRNLSSGFTLMEMMVAVTLVVVVIVAVGMLAKSMGKIVSLSQASNEMMSNNRSAQTVMERDFASIDRTNGFLVIRSRTRVDVNGVTQRADMVSFVASGNFANRSGNYGQDTSGNPVGVFADSTSATGALIVFGQPCIEMISPPGTGNYIASNQGTACPQGSDPSGVKDTDFMLGRFQVLLMAPNGTSANSVITYPSGLGSPGILHAAYSDPGYGTAAVTPRNSGESAADITSGRLGIAAVTPGELMLSIQTSSGRTLGTMNAYEANKYCFRFKVLADVYQSEAAAPNYANAVFRCMPILLQGCSNFAVEWTDGSVNADQTMKWYGLSTAAPAGVAPSGDTSIETTGNGDLYTAVFSYDNKAKWPKALRVRYHMTDRNDRLNGGRDFTQVIRLPG